MSDQTAIEAERARMLLTARNRLWRMNQKPVITHGREELEQARRELKAVPERDSFAVVRACARVDRAIRATRSSWGGRKG
jgi:hypothetical protein